MTRPAGGYLFNKLKNKLKGDSSRGDKTIAEMKKKRAAAKKAKDNKNKNVRQPNLYPPKADSFKPKTELPKALRPSTNPLNEMRKTPPGGGVKAPLTGRSGIAMGGAGGAGASAKTPSINKAPMSADAVSKMLASNPKAKPTASGIANKLKNSVKPATQTPMATTAKKPVSGAGMTNSLADANIALNKKNAANPKKAKPSSKPISGAGMTNSLADANIALNKKNAANAKKAKPSSKPTEKKDAAAPKRATVTGKGGRNVGTGKDKKANVTKEQLTKTGLTLRDYLNFMDENKRRPTKADAAAAKKLTAGFKAKKAKPVASKSKNTNKKFSATNPNTGGGPGMSSVKTGTPRQRFFGAKAGGMMRSKMGTKGGAMGGMKAGGMKTKGYKAGGMKDLTGDGQITQKDILKGRGVPGFKGGGMKTKGYKAGGMKTKGYKAGGMKTKGYKAGGMKTKGYKVGGMKGKSKVRGAGIARKGVRPAKII